MTSPSPTSRRQMRVQVAMEIAYRIRGEGVAAFVEAASYLRARRAAATLWRLYHDLAEPARCVERFIVTS